MSDFRVTIISRLCRQLQPSHILLVGGRTPALAEMLTGTATATGATLHVAAQSPADWLRALRGIAGDLCVLHDAPAVAAIGVLPVPQICWLDTDPNWCTTSGILQAVAQQATRLAQPFPVTIIENAGWPYGRRDSYDDPAAIPEIMLRPHERAGLLPGRAATAGGAGLFSDRYNAVSEDEPGNGVLTAIEDFMEGRTGELRLVVLPGSGGVAAIYPRGGPAAHSFSAEAMAEYALAAVGSLENIRLEQEVALHEMRAAVDRARSLNDTLREQQAARTAVPAQAAVDTPAPSAPFRRAASRFRRRIGSLRVAVRPRPTPAAPEAAHADELAENSAAGDATAAVRDAEIAQVRASPAFDAAWYLNAYHDVAESGEDPAQHYVLHGAAEMRDPGPFFSTSYYLSTYPDVADAGINPLAHYLGFGAAEQRNPAPHFNTEIYLAVHPDAAAGGLTPLEHFLMQRGNRG